MDLNLLKTFAGVLRSGSFAAYARETGVDPSSVSRSIAALEAALGIRLFERSTRRMVPTEAGLVYSDRIGPLLDALSEAADVARDVVSEPSGRLRVTTSVALGERWLVPRLADFRARHPRITLDLRLTDTDLELAAEGLDVALRHAPRVEGAYVVTKLFDTRYRVVAAPAYLCRRGRPSRPEDLAAQDAIGFSLPGHGPRWRLYDRKQKRRLTVVPQIVMTVSNALALRRAAFEGMGVALLADWTIAADLASGALIDLFPDVDARATDEKASAWILYRDRRSMPARLRLFIDYLKEAV
ncbi:MAG: LysR family transcriptional regulator [Pseudomonadota bacterium]